MVMLGSIALPSEPDGKNIPLEPTVSHAVQVLKLLFQRQQQTSAPSSKAVDGLSSPQHVLASLARRFGSIRHPSARACVIWLVGQYAGTSTGEASTVIPGMYDWAPDILRLVAKSFPKEVIYDIIIDGSICKTYLDVG
jgi:AP-3 complex subunit beta